MNVLSLTFILANSQAEQQKLVAESTDITMRPKASKDLMGVEGTALRERTTMRQEVELLLDSGDESPMPQVSQSRVDEQSSSLHRRTKKASRLDAALLDLRRVVGKAPTEATLKRLLERSALNVTTAANKYFDSLADIDGVGSSSSVSSSQSKNGGSERSGRKRLSLSKRPKVE